MSVLPKLCLAAGLSLTGTAASAATIEVTIEKLEFRPAMVKARPGDTIVWRNKDVMDHTATSRGNFDVVIPAGKSGSTAVKNSGSFDYDCRYHPNMKGRLEVGR
ncbi:cupredoxin domain-containing protein [Rhizobium mesosinicum]|uniref:Cupredoxin domain-containing protein n=1 Tax=Rhizobium mesosinicum TaxID=335017 RepID=A0ABS7GYI8_9HYPH|nr:cupredoxin domain-containing protein [Rhizobium mesosinicum]MBW9054945.1 cupredoxin domain-containing protein [Rhizobium mesosinicum]